ncbi:hypothetical protein H072_8327 [Dactylellina haptotyla CBS 200.50]|uniref:Peptidase metallopeptidase domain-containing protein n=1 Tax=Dactylellina haptotyla (strain CBS 200.50) TaxID=1284197 RepID=S8AA47_DACHA|nr:hypothetical protein H072_8327 [Dactylellina haptotyla CBS 200.50]
MCHIFEEEIQETVENIQEDEKNIREFEDIYICTGSHCKRQTGGRKWAKGHVFRYRVSGVFPGSRPEIMEQAFQKAQQKWAKYMGFKFEKATGAPNLLIEVVDSNHPQFRGNGAAGVASSTGPTGGPSQIWLRGPSPRPWNFGGIHTIFLHELGHILGFAHSNNKNAIMAPTIQDMWSERQLTPNDSERAQAWASGGDQNAGKWTNGAEIGGPNDPNRRNPGRQQQRPQNRFSPAQQRQRFGPPSNRQPNRFNPAQQRQQPFPTRGRTQAPRYRN